MMKKDIPIFSPGDLVEFVYAPDQSLYHRKRFTGKLGLIIKRCDQYDAVNSSANIYNVFIDGVYINLHALDFMLISKVKE